MNILLPSLLIGMCIAVNVAAVQPNFIIIQPDDYRFFMDWIPPAQFDPYYHVEYPPYSTLPNINRIRSEGLDMVSAYTASSMCGTSRYSTVTGRYPSRSSYGRDWDKDQDFRSVWIPRTKLEDMGSDVPDPNDCSENNIAVLLKQNGYRTGVVGKWHLHEDDGGTYSYEKVQEDINTCGFEYAEAIYKENLWGSWYGNATHNMEHVASRGIEFIQSSVQLGKPFFLYFNPTIPHPSGDVTDALKYADCRDTVEGRFSDPPSIPYGMTADFDDDESCRKYRQSVLDRGGEDHVLAGSVWVDDAIGSLFQTLESFGDSVLDNTIIWFQMDHGIPVKGSLFEPGIRIAQFIRYPQRFSHGQMFAGEVSTIDVAPTIADLAGVSAQDRYPMDGKSWLSEVDNQNVVWSEGNERCVFSEEGDDRSVRCACTKYIYVHNLNRGRTVWQAWNQGLTLEHHNFYFLCDENNFYTTSPDLSREWQPANFEDFLKNQLKEKIECHWKRTDPGEVPDYDTRTCDEPLFYPCPDNPDNETL